MNANFTIDGRLPGLNEIIGAINIHRYKGATLKKKETARCMWAIIAGHVPTFTDPVRIGFRWIEPNMMRDPDNISAGAKYVLDALVQLKRIPNDTRRWVKSITHDFAEPDGVSPRVEVTINATRP
jgi:hypothetical protein